MTITSVQIIRQAWHYFKTGFFRCLGVGIIASLANILLTMHLLSLYENFIADDTLSAHQSVLGLLLMIGSIIIQAFALGFMIEHFNNLDRKSNYSTFQIAYLTVSKFKRLLPTYLIVAILFSLGLNLFFIPGLIVATFFLIATPLVLFENQTPFAALKTSAKTLKPYFFIILSIVCLNTFLQLGLPGLLNLLTHTTPETAPITGLTPHAILVSHAINSIVSIFVNATSFAAYKIFKTNRTPSSSLQDEQP